MKTKIGIIILVPLIIIFFQMNCHSKGADETKNRDNLKKISKENLTGTYEILNEDGEINIPFEIFRNDIRMVAQVNSKECYILLDNGSLWDELLFFGSPQIDSLQLNVTGETVIGDTTVENPLMADIATGISIGFGDVVFNYFNNKMVLEPNQTLKDPFKFNMTGLEFTPDPQKNLRVTNVYPNSSASEVDIQIGDIITHINGARISEYKAEEISLLFKNEGNILELEILRVDHIQHKTITLKQVL